MTWHTEQHSSSAFAAMSANDGSQLRAAAVAPVTDAECRMPDDRCRMPDNAESGIMSPAPDQSQAFSARARGLARQQLSQLLRLSLSLGTRTNKIAPFSERDESGRMLT